MLTGRVGDPGSGKHQLNLTKPRPTLVLVSQVPKEGLIVVDPRPRCPEVYDPDLSLYHKRADCPGKEGRVSTSETSD